MSLTRLVAILTLAGWIIMALGLVMVLAGQVMGLSPLSGHALRNAGAVVAFGGLGLGVINYQPFRGGAVLAL